MSKAITPLLPLCPSLPGTAATDGADPPAVPTMNPAWNPCLAGPVGVGEPPAKAERRGR